MNEEMICCISDDAYAPHFLERRLLAENGIRSVLLSECLHHHDFARRCQAIIYDALRIDEAIISRFPSLRIISRYGAGTGIVDLDLIRELGIWLATVPDYFVEDVVTHACGLLLAGSRNFFKMNTLVRAGLWGPRISFPLHQLQHQNLGLIGFGNIGREIAKRMSSFFGRIYVCDPHINSGSGFPYEWTDLNTLFHECSSICYAAPWNQSTDGILDGRLLNFGPSALNFVNLADLRVFNLEDLKKALNSNRFSMLAIDVPDIQPIGRDHWLLQHDEVILTPHCAYFSEESEVELRTRTVMNVVSWKLRGSPDTFSVSGRGEHGDRN